MTVAEHVLAKWDKPAGKMDWLAFETCLVDILRSDFNPVDKVALSKEAIDAFTRRGHFQPAEYYWNDGPETGAA